MKNLVTTKWLGGMVFESDNSSGHTIKIDVDAENGGENSGLRPKSAYAELPSWMFWIGRSVINEKNEIRGACF